MHLYIPCGQAGHVSTTRADVLPWLPLMNTVF